MKKSNSGGREAQGNASKEKAINKYSIPTKTNMSITPSYKILHTSSSSRLSG
jgi:hypothetical protein